MLLSFDFGTDVFLPCVILLRNFLDMQFTFFGATVHFKSIFIFGFLVTAFFQVLRLFREF